MLSYKRLMNTPAAGGGGGGGFDPEANLINPVTVARDGQIQPGSTVDAFQNVIFAFTAPSNYTPGSASAGLLINVGGFNGFVAAADTSGRIGAFTTFGTSGALVITTDGQVLDPSVRIVIEYQIQVGFRIWANGNEPATTTVNGPFDNRWTGNNVGGYLTQSSLFVSTGTDEPLEPNWLSLNGEWKVLTAPGWSDLTIYNNQVVT